MVKNTDISSQKGLGKVGDDTTATQEGTIQIGIDDGKLVVIPTKSAELEKQNTVSMIDLLSSIDRTLKLLLTNMELMRSS